jgi:hypothetical protein
MTKRRIPLRFAGVAVASALTALLAQHATSAAFTASTADGGNQVTAAASFCASPGSTTLTASADSTGYQQNPTTTYGTSTSTGVGSQTGANGRVVVRFTLPALGAHCDVTAATLRLYANSPVAGATIDAYRADPTAPLWTEAGLTWNTLPAPAGTAVGSASLGVVGWQQWTVTSHVQTLYTTANNGFLLKDRTENAATGRWQLYDSDEATNKPELLITWG